MQPYREAYNPKGEIVAQTKKSTLTILKALPNDLFETTHADFQKAVRQDFQVTQGKTYNVSGTDLLDAIEENTRSGHTAGADNNKNGAFDPSRDRHGLGKVVDKFTDKVLDNPIVRTVAQIAQFTPLAPVASVVNTVITARDVVKAVDEGNIKSLASAVIGAGLSSKLSNSLNLAGDATKISVAQQLQKHALDGLTRATVSTVVEGGDFDDQLKSSLKATAATIVSQIGANKIGDLYSEGKLDNVTHKLAHTALGFAAGTVANGDGISGAVGGLAGSVAGEYFQSENAAVLASAATAALLGKDPLLAANVAGTADRFNRQLHQTEIDLIKQNAKHYAQQQKCEAATGGSCSTQAASQYSVSAAEIKAAENELRTVALSTVDKTAHHELDDVLGEKSYQQAENFLKSLGTGNKILVDNQWTGQYLFKATPLHYENPLINLAFMGKDIDAYKEIGKDSNLVVNTLRNAADTASVMGQADSVLSLVNQAYNGDMAAFLKDTKALVPGIVTEVDLAINALDTLIATHPNMTSDNLRDRDEYRNVGQLSLSLALTSNLLNNPVLPKNDHEIATLRKLVNTQTTMLAVIEGGVAANVGGLKAAIGSYKSLAATDFKSVRNIVRSPEDLVAGQLLALKQAGLNETVTKTGVRQFMDNNGRLIAEMDNRVLKFKYSGYGGDIVVEPGKTTTTLGRFKEGDGSNAAVGTRFFLGSPSDGVNAFPTGSFSRGEGKAKNLAGMNFLDIDEVRYLEIINRNMTNVRNDPANAGLPVDKLTSMGWDKGNNEFWEKYNLPFLEDAFKRGDNIRLVSDQSIENYTGTYKKELDAITGRNGGINLIEKHNYFFDKETSTYKKITGK